MTTAHTQLLVYRFDADARFEGRLVGALERIESGGTLRIIEALFVARDAESGELAAVDLRSRGPSARSPPAARACGRSGTRSRLGPRSRRCSSSTTGRGRSRTPSQRREGPGTRASSSTPRRWPTSRPS